MVGRVGYSLIVILTLCWCTARTSAEEVVDAAYYMKILKKAIKAGNWKIAVEFSDKLISLSFTDPNVLYYKAFALYKLGKVYDSYVLARKLFQVVDGDLKKKVALLLIQIYGSLGMLEKAKVLAEIYFSKDAKNVELKTIAGIFLEKGDIATAEKWAERYWKISGKVGPYLKILVQEKMWRKAYEIVKDLSEDEKLALGDLVVKVYVENGKFGELATFISLASRRGVYIKEALPYVERFVKATLDYMEGNRKEIEENMFSFWSGEVKNLVDNYKERIRELTEPAEILKRCLGR